MVRNSRQPGTGKQKWQCAIKNRERAARWYDALDGTQFNGLLLKRRRTKALLRMKQRTEGSSYGTLQGQGRD